MFNIFSQTFMMNALILGLALAIAAAFLSPFLILNNQAMIADGISHVAFTGIILGFLVSEQPLYFAIPFVVFASIIITMLSDKAQLNNDAAISVVSSFSLAIGLIVATLGSGFNRSIESLLVGSILTLTTIEVLFSIFLVLVIIVFVLLNYRSLVSMTFDLDYAKFSKIKTKGLRYSLSIVTALFVVIGVRTVGTLLISAFTVFPALIASQVSVSFKKTLMVGVLVSIVTIFFGIVISYHLGYPTGSAIVVLFTIILGFAYIVNIFLRRK